MKIFVTQFQAWQKLRSKIYYLCKVFKSEVIGRKNKIQGSNHFKETFSILTISFRKILKMRLDQPPVAYNKMLQQHQLQWFKHLTIAVECLALIFKLKVAHVWFLDKSCGNIQTLWICDYENDIHDLNDKIATLHMNYCYFKHGSDEGFVFEQELMPHCGFTSRLLCMISRLALGA